MTTLLDEIFSTVKDFVYNGPLKPKPAMLLFSDDGHMYTGTYVKNKEGKEFSYINRMEPEQIMSLYYEIKKAMNNAGQN